MTEWEVLNQDRENKANAKANAAKEKELASLAADLQKRAKKVKKEERALNNREKQCAQKEEALAKKEKIQEERALRKKLETRYHLLRAEYVSTQKIPWGTRLEGCRTVDVSAVLENVFKVSCITPYSIELSGKDVFSSFLADAEKHGYMYYTNEDVFYRTLLGKLTVLWENFGQKDTLPIFQCKTNGDEQLELCVPFQYRFGSRYSGYNAYELVIGLEKIVKTTLLTHADEVRTATGLAYQSEVGGVLDPNERGNHIITVPPSCFDTFDFSTYQYEGFYPFSHHTRRAFCENTWHNMKGIANIRLIANYSRSKWQVDFLSNTMPVSPWAQDTPSSESYAFFEP